MARGRSCEHAGRVTGARITYVGHATVLVELDGVRLLTDPILRDRVLHLRRVAPPAAPEVAHGVDAVVVSHAHWDHLDVPSLDRVGKQVRMVVPRGAGTLLRRRGFADVVELVAGERTSVGAIEVEATHAEHDGGRGPLGGSNRALGFVFSGSRRVYFAGDTDLFDGMCELAGEGTGGLDVALVPVWGWGGKAGAGHLDPPRAAEAVRLLRPRLAIPIHWGTLRVAYHRADSHPRPAEEFAELVAELAPETDVRVLAPGEALDLAAE
jgi:L-ascorbate metabolism protein UlaG (beta-lactamase superfamily)